MGLSLNCGCHLRGPYNKDYSILGSMLGSAYFRKLTHRASGLRAGVSSFGLRVQGYGQVLGFCDSAGWFPETLGAP